MPAYSITAIGGAPNDLRAPAHAVAVRETVYRRDRRRSSPGDGMKTPEGKRPGV